MSENKKLHFCFVDFMKAYDSIWPEALFKKLLGYGISANFVSFLKNLNEKTKISVRLSRGITDNFSSNVGLNRDITRVCYVLILS